MLLNLHPRHHKLHRRIDDGAATLQPSRAPMVRVPREVVRKRHAGMLPTGISRAEMPAESVDAASALLGRPRVERPHGPGSAWLSSRARRDTRHRKSVRRSSRNLPPARQDFPTMLRLRRSPIQAMQGTAIELPMAR